MGLRDLVASAAEAGLHRLRMGPMTPTGCRRHPTTEPPDGWEATVGSRPLGNALVLVGHLPARRAAGSWLTIQRTP